MEQYDVNSKYERRDREGNPELEDLSFSHMSKMYRAFWGEKKKDDENNTDDEDTEAPNEVQEDKNTRKKISDESDDDNEEFSCLCTNYNLNQGDLIHDSEQCLVDKFKFVMKYPLNEGEGEPLPNTFKLIDPYPGEPPYMKLRSKPAALRFHKYNAERDADAYWYSEALLYLPHKHEQDLEEKVREAKSNINGAWDVFVAKISHVKEQVMEYVEDNEEARLMAAEMFIDNNLTGEFMDPQGEQNNEDDQLKDIVQQEAFEHLNPEFAEPPEDHIFEEAFRPIEVQSLQELRIQARKLDVYQRKVLEIGIKHARALVKTRGGKNPLPSDSPLVMVDGAAGSGKSCTINILKQFLKLIMQQPGDNPECPYVLLCAPTGTAAVNISGQTLHTTFSFT